MTNHALLLPSLSAVLNLKVCGGYSKDFLI
jgi:hypothetical protein